MLSRKMFLFLLLMPFLGRAQDFTNFKNQKPVEFSGRVSVGLSTYQTARELPQFNPYSYMINASPTLRLYGIAIPFTIIYSERERSFRQPLNRIGASPSYKWVKLHLGQRNVHFNPYTLAGHTFLGYGAELSPGIFKVGFIKGRFNREVRNIQGIESFIQPSFDRKGWAANVGVGNNTNYIDFSLLKASDDVPIAFSEENFGSEKPAENIALGLKGGVQFLKYFSLNFNVAGSVFTEDQTALSLVEIAGDNALLERIPNGLFIPRVNTTFKFARDASIQYSGNLFNLRLGYKRIDPQYQSMGAYRFLTDIEDYTFSPSFTLFKRSVRISGTYGLQRNNISGLKLQTSTRQIGSVNIGYFNTSGFTTNISFNNFRTDAITVDEQIFSDSFDIIQVSENLNVRFQIPLGKEKKYNISLATGQQRYNREIELGQTLPENINRNFSANLNHRPGDSGLGYSIGANGQLISGHLPQKRLGIRANVYQKISDQVRLSLFVGGQQSFSEINMSYRVLNASLRGTYMFKDNQAINLSIRYINRNDLNNSERKYNDLRSQLNYSIRF